MSNAQAAAVPALIVRRTFNAPRERVFAAWTSAELLPRWFGTPNMTVGEVTFDARLGGRYRIPMTTTDGEEFNVGGVITEFRAPERLAYTFRWEEDDAALEFDTFVSVDFIEHGAQTEVVLTHAALASEASRDRHAEGWSELLDNLATIL